MPFRPTKMLGVLHKSNVGEVNMKPSPAKDINEYIEKSHKVIQPLLYKIRLTIKKAAPDAEEKISYQIPAFKQHEVLVYFAAFTDHISFFPTSSGVVKFSKELKRYETSKGTIKFPLDKPIPYGLISKITRFRVNEVRAKVNKKKKK